MNRFTFILFAAMLVFVAGAQPAAAQSIAVYSGNGQLICYNCANVITPTGFSSTNLTQFDPLYVRVTDANGNPVPNATVNWNPGQNLFAISNTSTQTDANGISHFTVIPAFTSFNGPVQGTVTASLATNAGAVATFTLTHTSLNSIGSDQIIRDLTNNPYGTVPLAGTTITGTAGSSGQAFTLGITGAGTSLQGGLPGIMGPMAGISVRLVNFQSSPTVTCATGAGADPGSVLTDSTGNATCTPVFAGSGFGQFAIIVGGVVMTGGTLSDGAPAPAQPPFVAAMAQTGPNAPQPTYAGYIVYPLNLQVTAASVAAVQTVSGNNQSANVGTQAASPLVAVVQTAQGNPLAGQTVTWTVSPSNAATLSSYTSSSDVNGRASVNVTLTNSASGTVTVTATSNGKSAAFTLSAVVPVTVSGVQKLSGDTQTAVVNTGFSNPLIVQVTSSNGQPAVSQTVVFTISGPGTLSINSTATDSSGKAQASVTAGNTAGTIAVTASSAGYAVTFTLTVAAPGPVLTAGSFYNAADFQVGSISPCSIATIIAPGLAPNLQGSVYSSLLGFGYMSYTVGGDTVTVGGAQAPIYSVSNMNGQQQLSFQVPCSVTPGTNIPVTVNAGSGSATINLTVQAASPGIFPSPYTATVAPFGNLPVAMLVKRDGTLVSPQNPARRGESVIAYVTGLGPTQPLVATNALPIFGTPSAVTGQVIVGVQNAGVQVNFAQLSEDLIGVYLVSFTIPANAPQGNDVFSIGLVPAGGSAIYYSNAAAIVVQ